MSARARPPRRRHRRGPPQWLLGGGAMLVTMLLLLLQPPPELPIAPDAGTGEPGRSAQASARSAPAGAAAG